MSEMDQTEIDGRTKAARLRREAAVEAKTEERTTRRRTNFGAPSLKLGGVVEIPGFHQAWINDSGSSTQQAIDGGWEFVQDALESNDLGDKVRRLVGTQESGQPLYAYLMKIKEEWYQEDQKLIQDQVDATDARIRSGNVGATVGQDGRYIPPGGIQIK